jgi:phosphohistidine phosphatase
MTDNADRKLVLLRHAKSAWPDVPDHERPLAGRGRRDAPVMGHWLRTAGHVPDRVLCSTARRARETWELAQTTLGASPPVSFEDRVYGASAPELLDLIHRAPGAVQTLLIVGHDPGIPELAFILASAATPGRGSVPRSTLDRMKDKFPTAAIALLELTGTWSELDPGEARLTSFATPREVSSGGPGSS